LKVEGRTGRSLQPSGCDGLTGRSQQASRALLLAAAALLPFHELTLRVGPVGLRPFESCLLLALAAALPAIVVGWREWSRPRPVDRAVAAVVLLGALSLLVARGPGESLRMFRLVILEPALCYLLLTRLLADRRGVRQLVGALVLGGVAASLVGFGQLATGVGPIEAEGVDRIRATYRSPNNLALLLDRVAPLAVALTLAGAGWVWAAAAAALLLALALTYSVGGWLATATGLAVVLVLARGRRALVPLALIGALAVAGTLVARPEYLVGQLDLGPDSTSGVRVLLWRAAVEMLRDHPLFGIGLDNFVYRYNPERGGDYLSPEGWREPDLSHPHNLLLDWWLSLGVLGALLLLRLLVLAWRLGRKALAATAGDRVGRALAVGWLGSLVATLAHGLIDNSFFLPDLAALWWMGLGALAILAEEAGDPSG
jgi:putative inorganic carbon (HCO3(-)) transporter